LTLKYTKIHPAKAVGGMLFYEKIFCDEKRLTTLFFSAILYPWFAKYYLINRGDIT
jgi:hypothetical protein